MGFEKSFLIHWNIYERTPADGFWEVENIKVLKMDKRTTDADGFKVLLTDKSEELKQEHMTDLGCKWHHWQANLATTKESRIDS